MLEIKPCHFRRTCHRRGLHHTVIYLSRDMYSLTYMSLISALPLIIGDRTEQNRCVKRDMGRHVSRRVPSPTVPRPSIRLIVFLDSDWPTEQWLHARRPLPDKKGRGAQRFNCMSLSRRENLSRLPSRGADYEFCLNIILWIGLR